MTTDISTTQTILARPHPKDVVYVFVGDHASIGDALEPLRMPHNRSEPQEWGAGTLAWLQALKWHSKAWKSKSIDEKLAHCDFSKMKVYFERTDADGLFEDAMPCKEVYNTMWALGISLRNVYFTGKDQRWHQLLSRLS